MAKKKAKIKGTVTPTPISKAPAISKIELSGSTFTVTWTKGENYSGNKSGQELVWWLDTDQGQKQKTTIKPGASATSATINNIDTSALYPNSGKPIAHKFWVQVRGKNTGKLWSPVATRDFNILPPPAPTVTHEDNATNKATFSWSGAAGDNAPITDVKYQTVAKVNCPGDISTLSEWRSAALSGSGTSGSQAWTEADLTNSITRCVRAVARGIGGDSAWTYDKRVYAQPKAPQNVDSVATTDPNSNTITVTSGYNTPDDAAHPVEKTTHQYLITVPGPNVSVPVGEDFSDFTEAADTSGTQRLSMTLPHSLDLDQVLFTRIKAEWGGQVSYSDIKCVSKAKLKTPTNMSVSVNQTNYKATITVTNASDVPDSYIAIYCSMTTTPPQKPFMIGYIPHGSSSVTVQCPNWTGKTPVGFIAKAIVGSTPTATSRGSYSIYSIASVQMESDEVEAGGAVPVAPTSTSARQVSDDGTILVTWNWPWEEADSSEISWSDHDDAWESTDEPDTYEISNLHAAQWKISGCALGEKWYVRVRLIRHNGDEATYGPYCNTMTVDLSAAPATPVIRLDNKIIRPGGNFTVSWDYGTNDGTMQSLAEIYEIVSGSYRKLGSVKTAQHLTLNAQTLGWAANTQHTLTMQVLSDSNRKSAYAPTTVITVANPLTCSIAKGSGFTGSELKAMPMTVTVTGAGGTGITTLVIERAQSYDLEMPDETVHNGYAGETIYLNRYKGSPTITINNSDLIGRLDDTAVYRLVATVEDSYGQSAQAAQQFTVNWTNQAIMPEGTAVLDTEEGIVRITPTEPTGAHTGDTVNIYRLSADRPKLIYEGAQFGTTYVDPYPTVGEYGGYRLAYMTANGDFITSGYYPAVLDIEVEYNIDNHFIDFDKLRIPLVYNLTSDNEWSKNFKKTRYLGGSMTGDWTSGVDRSGSADTVTITDDNEDVKEGLRRLADYPGLCHVRTRDGSNFVANVDVQESMSYDTAGKISEFSLDFDVVDNPDMDAMTEEDWEAENEVE